MPVLSVTHIRKTFRDFWLRPVVDAVKDVTFAIEPGEVFGLVGPNGSGKSTLIRMILGLLRADGGEIRVFGSLPTEPEARRSIGYLPEISYLHPFLTPKETLSYYGRLSNLSGQKLRTRIADLLRLVNLESVADRRVGTFSKGMTRRVGLAQALINAPKLLILDEPTSGLDPIGTREVKDLILELKARGIAVLMSSHLLADMQDCCDRVLILDHGECRAQGCVREMHESLESFFLQALHHASTLPPLQASGGISWLGTRS